MFEVKFSRLTRLLEPLRADILSQIVPKLYIINSLNKINYDLQSGTIQRFNYHYMSFRNMSYDLRHPLRVQCSMSFKARVMVANRKIV